MCVGHRLTNRERHVRPAAGPCSERRGPPSGTGSTYLIVAVVLLFVANAVVDPDITIEAAGATQLLPFQPGIRALPYRCGRTC